VQQNNSEGIKTIRARMAYNTPWKVPHGVQGNARTGGKASGEMNWSGLPSLISERTLNALTLLVALGGLPRLVGCQQLDRFLAANFAWSPRALAALGQQQPADWYSVL